MGGRGSEEGARRERKAVADDGTAGGEGKGGGRAGGHLRVVGWTFLKQWSKEAAESGREEESGGLLRMEAAAAAILGRFFINFVF